MPTNPVLSEGYYTGGFMVSEANGHLSRDAGTVYNAAGSLTEFPAGLVVARNALGAVTAAAKAGGNTGAGTCTVDATTPTVGGAQVGVYTLRCITAVTNGGVFRLTDPGGRLLGDYTIPAGAGNSVTITNQIKVAIADANPDFVVGDGFDVTVAVGNGQWVPFTNAATQTQIGVLFNRRHLAATSGSAATIITRLAEVNASELQYDASLTGGTLTAAKTAAAALLAASYILAR